RVRRASSLCWVSTTVGLSKRNVYDGRCRPMRCSRPPSCYEFCRRLGRCTSVNGIGGFMKKIIVLFILLCMPVLANAQCVSISKFLDSVAADYGKALFWRYGDNGKLKFLMVTPRIRGQAGKHAVYHLPWKLYVTDNDQ